VVSGADLATGNLIGSRAFTTLAANSSPNTTLVTTLALQTEAHSNLSVSIWASKTPGSYKTVIRRILEKRLSELFIHRTMVSLCAAIGLIWAGHSQADMDWRATLNDPEASIENRVAAAFEGMAKDDCFDGGEDTADCPRRRFTLSPSHADSDLIGRESVLIVDVLPPAVEYLRYRNRILGAYQVTPDHSIAELPIVFDLPETSGEIITGLASSMPIPSEALAVLLPEMNRRYGDHIPVASAHGTAVFSIFADLAPGQPIVLLDNNLLTFNQSDKQLFCSIPDHPERLVVLRQRAQRFAEELRDLMTEHNVRYVNASFGYTIETVRGPWQSVCGTEVPPTHVLRSILETYRPIFEALFSTPGVITAHAALASPNDLDAPFDQPGSEFPNRLRVGSLGHNGANIPATGTGAAPTNWNPVPPDPNDSDIWVNAGCTALGECRVIRPLSLSTRYGMGRSVFPLPQSSFVTPIALAQIIDLRNRRPFRDRQFDDSLIDDLIIALTGACTDTCRHFDPLLHGQAERFRNDFKPERELAGLWYDPQRNGHGLEIQRFGAAHAGLLYTFGDDGKPEWLWLDMERYGGTLYGSFVHIRNDGTAVDLVPTEEPVGQFTITFEANEYAAACPDASGPRAAFNWSIGNETGIWCLQPLLVNGSQSLPNANGLWWNGAEDSGWGFGRYANEVTEFRVIYTYDEDGSPIWVFGQTALGQDQFDLLYPGGYCRTCSSMPLTLQSAGAFEGAVDSPSNTPSSDVSIWLDHWQRIGIRPERLSD